MSNCFMMRFQYPILLLVGLAGLVSAEVPTVIEGVPSVDVLGELMQSMSNEPEPIHGRKLLTTNFNKSAINGVVAMVDEVFQRPPKEWLAMLTPTKIALLTQVMVMKGIKKGPVVESPDLVHNTTEKLCVVFDTIVEKKPDILSLVLAQAHKQIAAEHNVLLANVLTVLTYDYIEADTRDILVDVFLGNHISEENYQNLQKNHKLFKKINEGVNEQSLPQILQGEPDAAILKAYETEPKSGKYGTRRPDQDVRLYEFMALGKGEMTMALWASLVQRFKIPDDIYVAGFNDEDRAAKRAYMRQFIRRQIKPETSQRFLECQHFDEGVIMSLVSKGAIPPTFDRIVVLGTLSTEELENLLSQIDSFDASVVDTSGVVVAGQYITSENVANAFTKYRRIIQAARFLRSAIESGRTENWNSDFVDMTGQSVTAIFQNALNNNSEMDTASGNAACLFNILAQNENSFMGNPKLANALKRIMAVWKPNELISPDSMSRIYGRTEKNLYLDPFRGVLALVTQRMTRSSVALAALDYVMHDENSIKRIIPPCFRTLFDQVVDLGMLIKNIEGVTTGKLIGFFRGMLEEMAAPNSKLYKKFMDANRVRTEVTKSFRGSK